MDLDLLLGRRRIGEINSVDFGGDDLVVSGGADKIQVFDRRQDIIFNMFAQSKILPVALSPDGQYIASGEKNGNLKVWEHGYDGYGYHGSSVWSLFKTLESPTEDPGPGLGQQRPSILSVKWSP